MGFIKLGAVPLGGKITIDISTVLAVGGLAVKAFFDFRSGDMNALVTDALGILAALGLSPVKQDDPTPPPPPKK